MVVIGDVVADVSTMLGGPVAHRSDTPARIEVQPGGSGANVAAWLAAYGAEVHLVGRVGADLLGGVLREKLERVGVVAHLGVDPERTTGVIVVLVHPSGERDMLTDRGANLALDRSDVPWWLWQSPGHLHLSGYVLFDERTRAVALEAMARARRARITVSVDPSSEAFLRTEDREDFLEWTQDADLCFPNLDEGRVLTGLKQPAAVARSLCAHYRAVALKLGAKGAVLATRAGELVRAPASPARVVDTTGAGDAFCAGFLAAWRDGAPSNDCLARALAASAVAVTKAGAPP